MQLRMQHYSLTSILFRPFTHRGPIVLVLIKQFLAPMNRDGHVYSGTDLTFTHACWIIRLAIVRRICI